MAKFCVECGKPVQPDWNVCAECGSAIVGAPRSVQNPLGSIPLKSIQYQQPYTQQYPKKSSREQWIKNSWAFSVVASIIGLLSFLAPYAYGRFSDGAIDFWWFGVGSITIYGYETIFVGWDGFVLIYLLTELISFFIVALLNFVVLIQGAKLRKLDKKFSNSLLVLGICNIIMTIAFLITINLISVIRTGLLYFSNLSPGFPIFWQFIGSGLIITGYFIGKMNPESAR